LHIRLAFFPAIVHTLFVTAALPLSATDRFALIMEGLCRAIAARSAGGRVAGPLIILIWNRLSRMAVRFAALAARVRSGALPSPAPVRTPAASRPASPRPSRPLPDGFTLLVRLAPEAACFGGQLQDLLSDPEMTALLSAAPQIGRLLRPLCRMLGVKPSPDLLPPPSRNAGSPDRPRPPGPTQDPKPLILALSRSDRVARRAT
jgi:hypothetical protein